MIIGVLADTHGSTEEICNQLKKWQIDCLLFAGDFYTDGQKIARNLKIRFYGVSGNCDSSSNRVKSEDLIELMDKKIYLTHGHQLGVKQGLNKLYYRACELGADVVIYGHTHTPYLEKNGDIWMINPGSPTRPRLRNKGTYALIEMDKVNFKPRLISLDN